MRLKNIECQLAQGQIGRYLAGADMSSEAVSQLELHIAECEECSGFIEEKREGLKKMTGEPKAVAYVAEEEPQPAPQPAKPNAAQALVQILQEKAVSVEKPIVLDATREPAPSKPIQWKAFIYSGALGLVLLLMSHFTANPTALFGERAVEKEVPAASEPKSDPVLASRDPFEEGSTADPAKENAPPATRASAPPDEQAEPSKPAETQTISKSSTPSKPTTNVQVTSRPVAPRKTKQIRRGSQQPQRSVNSIRVYDENGRLLSGT